jgi:hypothetical protein
MQNRKQAMANPTKATASVPTLIVITVTLIGVRN